MGDFTVGDGFAGDVVEVVFDDFGDEIDDALYLLASGEGVVFAEPEEVDDRFWENDLADLEVDLFIFQNLDFLDPPPNAHVLEDVDRDVDDVRFPRPFDSLRHLLLFTNYITEKTIHI